MRPLIALAAAALLASGCGGDGRDEAVQTAETWLRAVGDRDAQRACALMHESATDNIRRKSELNPRTNCLGALRIYADAFDPGDLDDILEVGLEAEGTVKKEQIGVFPSTGPHELQVILMRRVGGEWKVAGMSLGPAGTTNG